jgi:hypothetical protein
MSNYNRVIPRDIFNEAKLLKCIGKICLLIHDNKINGLNIVHEDQSKGFEITQDPNSGDISVENIYFFDNAGTPVYFYTKLNSKDNYPMFMEYKDAEYYPISEDGKLLIDKNLFTSEEQ